MGQLLAEHPAVSDATNRLPFFCCSGFEALPLQLFILSLFGVWRRQFFDLKLRRSFEGVPAGVEPWEGLSLG